MKSLSAAISSTFAGIRVVLTDMDETLTFRGRLAARTYDALERLQQAGIKVIPVTAAPAGWCDQMARMWPVDGVIGENGGLFYRRDGDHGVARQYWHGSDRQTVLSRLAAMGDYIRSSRPSARLADDQAFRLTSLAFARAGTPAEDAALLSALREAGASATINNLWVLGWLGGYDKLAMTRRVLAESYGIDIDADRDAVLFCGDSTNDAPMFGFFRHSVGVSTVRNYLAEIAVPPAWITDGPGGNGFVEAVDAVLAAGHR